MFQATSSIYNRLKSTTDLKVFTEEQDDYSETWLGFSAKNGSSYRIRFISNDNDNDVSVRVFGLVQVEEDKRAEILPILNSLNARFRYVKFTCDDDGDVNVEYDYPVSCSDPAESAKEIVLRFANIIDKAYPELMRALWA